MTQERGLVINIFIPNKSVRDPEAVARSIMKDEERLYEFLRENDWKIWVENYPPRPQDSPKPPAFDPDNGRIPKKPRDPNAKNPWAVG